jgi:hypothetical protein
VELGVNIVESGELEKRCLALWIALLDYTLVAKEHKSRLLSGVVVLGLKPDEHRSG